MEWPLLARGALEDPSALSIEHDGWWEFWMPHRARVTLNLWGIFSQFFCTPKNITKLGSIVSSRGVVENLNFESPTDTRSCDSVWSPVD